MERGTKIRTIILLAATLALSSCGGVINLPVPVVASLNPSSVVAGSVQFTLHVIGSGFAPNSQIWVDGAPRFADLSPVQTIFLSQSELTAIVPPAEISQPGTISVAVVTSAPGGGISAEQTLTVTPSTAPVPQILSIFPSSVLAGNNSATITVNGANFVNTSVADVNGSNRPTAFQSGIKLIVSLASTDIAIAGTVQVAILNPPVPGGSPPGGGLSNAMPVNVVNPSPTVSSLFPGSVVAGTTNFTLNVLGTGMDSASQVFINGSARPTSAVSPKQVFSQLASQDVATAGTFPVQVVNPPPGGGTSSTLLFSVVPSSKGVGLPELVDFSNNGTQADDGVSLPNESGPTMDSSGRFIAYASPATNLLLTINQDPTTNPDTNGVPDIFLFDSCLGTTSSCIPKTTLIDSGPNGVIANGKGSDPAMNSTGLELAFVSLATNLVPAVTFNGTTPQAFVASTCAGAPFGCIPVVSLVSIASDGVSPGNDTSSQVAISADGRFVAFVSKATNLVAGATTGTPEIYLRDTCLRAGGTCTPSTKLITTAPDGVTPADGVSGQPSVASGAFGQIVTFTSTATTIVSGSGGAQEVYARTLCIGVSTGCTPNTGQLVSTLDGTTFADGASVEPNINPAGRFVAFASTATNMGVASGNPQQIYLRDLCTGQGSVCTPSTSLVSLASDGTSPANGLCESPNMGNTAQFVAFASLASNLVAASTSGEQVFVRNTCNGFSTGCAPTTALVSVSSTGLTGNGQSLNPVLTATGHEIAFFSAASNLVNNDLNGFPDVFLAITTF